MKGKVEVVVGEIKNEEFGRLFLFAPFLFGRKNQGMGNQTFSRHDISFK
jgi:hypothetical protein